MNIGPLELVLIIIVVLIVVGGRRLPAAGRQLGSGIRNLIDSARGLHPADEEDGDASPPKLEPPARPPAAPPAKPPTEPPAAD